MDITKIYYMKLFSYLTIIAVSYTLLFASCKSDSTKSVTSTNDTTSNKDRMHIDSGSVKATNADTSIASVAKAAKADPNQSFINYAVQTNTKEILWLKAGVDKGVNKDLRAHAKMMLTDHQKLDEKVKAIIAKKNYHVPQIDTTNEVNINDKKGADWDKAWVGKMVADHMELSNMLTKAEKDITDTDLKTLITATIPVVKSHSSMVESLNKKIR